MKLKYSALAAACTLTLTAGCTTETHTEKQTAVKATAVSCQSAKAAPHSEMSISGLTLVGTHTARAEFDSSAAEIVNYDACTDQLFVVNAQAARVDVLRLDENSKPSSNSYIDLTLAGQQAGINIGAANSVSTYEGYVAVAIENANKQRDGIIAVYRADDLSLVATYPAGALPDMVSFSKDGRYIASANEGEPNDRYSDDPEGSVTLIDVQAGFGNAIVHQIDFRAFNRGEHRHSSLGKNVRISAPNATVAQDLEPEYLAFADNGKLYVAMQENNAIATIDVNSATVDTIWGLGSKSWGEYSLDASNKDKLIGNFQRYQGLEGLFMPDSIATYTVNGETFIVTANEGDGREYGFDTTQFNCDEAGYKWDGDDFAGTDAYQTEQDLCIVYLDEVRGAKLNVDPAHPLAEALADKKQLGRLKVIKPEGMLSADEPVQAFGARSFSIFNADGQLVFDSGSQFAHIVFAADRLHLNSTNDSNSSADDRSDDKGVEPEAITVANINDRYYAFIGLERQGGIMAYDVTDPQHAHFVTYLNNRHFEYNVCSEVNEDGECESGTYNPAAGDLGPESIVHFERTGQHFLAVGNEVSGTTSVFRIDF
ncbi:choice-of-anchor I family protein [Thaumasiovibrio subtropicus]|uniref:choice-of-anchor I family protein n=1 Tax=Thaumasiovibrio subtropicus TaxID=1891207 RepID=UPI000B357526|nr:choice-of-anchor I family protein [Thaumasiovibrio subtropicus]